MGIILQLSKSLLSPPEPGDLPGIELRQFRGPEDIPLWLDLRHRAFARETVGVRRWDEADFAAELTDKPWWSADRLWFAEASDAPTGTTMPVGTVTLAMRGTGPGAVPAIHWLCVLPTWRRRGVGRLLVAALEAKCWALGHRRIVLETHAAWTRAVRFYEALGYVPAAGRAREPDE
ncbi:MAG: GNAT family N-acetyltransferase [Planctomycetia bacterium]|nr:GNAT family N-acetyltransferase [Planctomycetia bacterium]